MSRPGTTGPERPGAVLAAVTAVTAVMLGLGAPEAAAPGPRAFAVSELAPRQLAGQRIVCGFDGTRAPASLRRVISAGELGGVILFSDNVRSRAQVARLSAALQSTQRPRGLRRSVIVSVDQEGGLVKRLPGPPRASAAVMGARGASFSRSQGAATAASLRGAGINVDLAPVLDVARRGGFISKQRRAFGSKPGRVAATGVAFAEGLESGGVAAAAKHFPGLGSTAANTDLRPSTIRLGAGALRRVDEAPYRAFSEAGGALVMVSSARYPALRDPKLPASQSKPVVRGSFAAGSGSRASRSATRWRRPPPPPGRRRRRSPCEPRRPASTCCSTSTATRGYARRARCAVR